MPQRPKKRQKLQNSDPVDHPEELPPCDGPKLGIFPHYQSPITWLDRLDNVNDHTDDEAVKKSYVFKVKIKSKFYALKVFRCFDPYENFDYWNGLVESAQEVEWHTSPFYAECRAHGRINEERRLGTLKKAPAVACFGYIILSYNDRETLRKKGIETEGSSMGSSDSESFSSWESHTLPLDSLGIVKELASQHSGLTNSNVGVIRKDILQLNKLHVYNTDITKRNYGDGKLVDFGSSWTEPHCYMVPDNSLHAGQIRDAGLVLFDKMIDKEGILSKWRTKPNRKYTHMLRSYTAGLKGS